MKKLVYIFSLLLLACACNLEDFEPQTNRDADKVKLSLSLSVPEAQSLTRVMGEPPVLSSLHLVVFDQNGMLVEYAEADLNKVTENLYSFDVKLTISDTPRSIHFVGNYTAAPKFGMETEVMTAMETASGADAYWYRKTIAKIEANEDGTPTKETKDAFGVIHLVRNFAKIKVTSTANNFVLDSYAIAGRPKKGKVVPYNRTKGDFQDFVYFDETDGLIKMKDYDVLTAEGYDAFSPTGVELDFTLKDSDFDGDSDGFPDNKPKYVYERETPLSDASYVIVKGYYNGDTEPVYYKINLRDNDGNYVPLRRNFLYDITITSVTRDGYKELKYAVASSGSGDISTNQDYIPMTNISNGDVRLSVEYTSKTLVTNKPVNLQVKFEKVGTAELGAVEFKLEKKDKTLAAIQNVEKTAGPENGGPGSYTYEVTPVAVSGGQKTQSLFIIGHYKIDGSDTDLTISREVSYTLMKKKDMKAQCIPSEVPNVQGQEFDLQITIPGDLGESMFPLEFNIEAVKLSITPKNDNMPVTSGTSTIVDVAEREGKSSFWFVKTLSWEEYEPMARAAEYQPISFLCHFATNMADSATDIYVSNPYFNQTSCTLDNYDNPNYFEKLTYNNTNPYPIVAKTPVTFTFTTTARPSQGSITVTLTGLDPAKGENQLTLPGKDANGNPKYTLVANDENSYTLNLVAADAYTDFNVKLEAYHFVTAQASAKRDRMNFSNLTLPTTRVGTQDVEFRFKYANNSVVPVRIKLTNLVSNDEHLVENKNEGVFVFTPTSDADTQTISLKTDSWGSKIGVKIVAADGYNVPVSVTANRTLKATISTGAGNNTKIYYSFDSSLSSYIGSQTTNSSGNITISLSGDQVEDASRTVYFWYTKRGWFGQNTTYLAKTSLEALAAESPTLTFE